MNNKPFMRYKMRLKLITIFLLFVGVFYYGCVEEPTNEPYNRPYSAVRLANMAANLETVRLFLVPLVPDVPELPDEPATTKGPFDLAPGAISDYFETPSGGYRLVVLAPNDDTLSKREVTIASFENMTVTLAGYYSTNTEENTFGAIIFPEGEIYNRLPPGIDSVSFFFIHGAPASPTADPAKIGVSVRYRPDGTEAFLDTNLTSIFTGGEFTAGEIEEVNNFPKGDYKFSFLNGSQVIASDSGYYDGNMRYYMFIYGTPENMKLIKNSTPPLPVRAKN
jgi:hypothetical protein